MTSEQGVLINIYANAVAVRATAWPQRGERTKTIYGRISWYRQGFDVLRAQRERKADKKLEAHGKIASVRCRWTRCCASCDALRTRRALRTRC
eukprot:6076208-Prymnesium_polylepis.1